MNKKGFTLVELICVIAIIGTLAVVAGVNYSKIIKDNKVRECKESILYIENQAIKYAEKHKAATEVRISVLSNEYEIDKNPITNNDFSGKVIITRSDSGLIEAEYLGDNCE